MFTLGRNTISLITNETCFVMTSVYIRQCFARSYLRNDYCEYDSTSRGSFNIIMIRPNTFKMADRCREEGSDQKIEPKLGLLSGQMAS